MKKVLNQLSYTLKGELQEFDSGVITAIKKEEEDFINLNTFFEEVKKFTEANQGKECDILLSLKASE